MPALLDRMIARVSRRFGRGPGPESPAAEPRRPDLDPADADILSRVRPYTMTSDERVISLVDAVRYLDKYEIPGAIVECGVWRGGSSMAAALASRPAPTREFYLYDTFEGMTEPTPVDKRYDGATAEGELRRTPVGTGVWCYAGLDEVRANIASTGYPGDLVRFVPGRVEDTIPATVPDSIALLRLDTDWYESTKHELVHLFPRLVRGGILIVDDYGHWQGSKQATDEYFAAGPPLYLQRIDYTGRIAVKL